jgi:glycerate kinase
LGFGLAAFLQARIFLGFKMFTRHARLNQRLRKADLVITGEGAMDGSTRMGKGVGMLIQRCQQVGVKCVAVAGKVTPEARGLRALSGAVAVTDYFSQTHAMQRPAASLEATAYRVSGIFGPPGV